MSPRRPPGKAPRLIRGQGWVSLRFATPGTSHLVCDFAASAGHVWVCSGREGFGRFVAWQTLAEG